jgi:tetratricopeptide (TPR) repeat protein
MTGALRELRGGLRLAEGTTDTDRTADVRATLGLTLVAGGRTREGLGQLARAADEARAPDLTAKVLMRRGLSLSWLLGRHDEALGDLQRALAGFREVGDPMWEARTRNALGLLHQAVGELAAAEDQIRTARQVFFTLGDEVEAAFTLHNLGVVAFLRGDLPEALATLDRADEQLSTLGVDTAGLALDRSEVLLAAGLAQEAVAVAAAELRRGTGLPVQRADLRLRAATAQLAAGAVRDASDQARAARAAFRRAGRTGDVARAELVVLRARERGGRVDRRLVAAAARVAGTLEAGRSEEAALAWVVAGRLAARVDRAAAAGPLARAAAHRTHPVPLIRATGWLARGLERELAGDRRGVLLACRRGLAALDLHRATLGSSELRALATAHGVELAQLALRHAVDRPPRDLLWWSERWRATALAQPPVRPRPEDEVSEPLAALRDNARRLAAERREDGDVALLEAERARLEHEVRRRLRRSAGGAAAPEPGIEVAELVGAVGDAAFVELVEVGDHLHAVVVHRGRVHGLPVGSTAAATRAVDLAGYALRRAARGRPAPIEDAGARLEVALLGPAARLLGDATVVVVSPTSRLHAAPWALLPALSRLSLSVVPSASLWLRARARRSPGDRRVFVCGPGLTTGGAEVGVVAARQPGATVLRDGTATVDRTLAALDGAALAHLAAHGRFRDDSPLFSALDLDDGPLTVHDFERMAVPPHRVVLSACESGVMAPLGAGELLGLVSALLSAGTAGVAASVEVVNDDATAELMVDLHAGLADGADLAGGLLRAREAARGDPVREATAAAFLALGV